MCPWAALFPQAKHWFSQALAGKQVQTIKFCKTAAFSTYMQKCAITLCNICNPQILLLWDVLGTLSRVRWLPYISLQAFSVQIPPSHLPLKSIYSMCVFLLSASSLHFCCHILWARVLKETWVLGSQQKAGNKSHHCAPYHCALIQRWWCSAQQLLSTGFSFRQYISLLYDHFPRLVTRVGYFEPVLNFSGSIPQLFIRNRLLHLQCMFPKWKCFSSNNLNLICVCVILTHISKWVNLFIKHSRPQAQSNKNWTNLTCNWNMSDYSWSN